MLAKAQSIASCAPRPPFLFLQADDAGLADTKDKEKAERAPVGPQHVLRWFGEVATHVKTQVDKVGLANSLAPCGLVVSSCPFGMFCCVFVPRLHVFVCVCRRVRVFFDFTKSAMERCLSQRPSVKTAQDGGGGGEGGLQSCIILC